MTIDTRDFGEMEVDQEGILHFEEPILGFDVGGDYVVLYDDEMGDMFSWLQSMQDKDLCFIMVDPRIIDPTYSPSLPREACNKLGLNKGDEPTFCSLISIPGGFADATANLKSPVVVNPLNHKALQLVLDEDYQVQAPLLQGGTNADT